MVQSQCSDYTLFYLLLLFGLLEAAQYYPPSRLSFYVLRSFHIIIILRIAKAYTWDSCMHYVYQRILCQ